MLRSTWSFFSEVIWEPTKRKEDEACHYLEKILLRVLSYQEYREKRCQNVVKEVLHLQEAFSRTEFLVRVDVHSTHTELHLLMQRFSSMSTCLSLTFRALLCGSCRGSCWRWAWWCSSFPSAESTSARSSRRCLSICSFWTRSRIFPPVLLANTSSLPQIRLLSRLPSNL